MGEASTSGKALGWAWKDAPGQVEGEEEHSSRREQHDQKLSGGVLPRDCERQANGGVESLDLGIRLFRSESGLSHSCGPWQAS